MTEIAAASPLDAAADEVAEVIATLEADPTAIEHAVILLRMHEEQLRAIALHPPTADVRNAAFGLMPRHFGQTRLQRTVTSKIARERLQDEAGTVGRLVRRTLTHTRQAIAALHEYSAVAITSKPLLRYLAYQRLQVATTRIERSIGTLADLDHGLAYIHEWARLAIATTKTMEDTTS